MHLEEQKDAALAKSNAIKAKIQELNATRVSKVAS